jgi:tetratricopeptide (TPR) repeat protein
MQERINQLTNSAAAAEALRAENAILKEQLALSKTSIPSTDGTNRLTTEAEARIAALQSDAQVLRLEKHALEIRLTNSVASASTNNANKELIAKVDQLTQEVTGLRSRVEVFEARAVPYTAEELALFQTENAKALAYTPDPKRKGARTLSAASAALVAEAQRNFAAKDFAKAEQNYLDVLRQEEGNPTALANLATIQMEAGKLEAAEKNIQQALAAEPNDGYNLATLGKIKYQEEKYDEALDALSRAARIIPQNAEIQNYLGVTLSQKGLRGPAETALRKAIQIDAGYGSAHNNLAVIYATQTPPLIELARWHYQKALAAGHPKNDDLEKLFSKKESAAK